jgi:hypothetical protein
MTLHCDYQKQSVFFRGGSDSPRISTFITRMTLGTGWNSVDVAEAVGEGGRCALLDKLSTALPKSSLLFV